jgi:hypothetical protein
MHPQTLYLSKREFALLTLILAGLFAIPLLWPLLSTSPVTPAWSSYYIGGAMVAHGLGSQLADVRQQTHLWQAVGLEGKEALPFIAPPYLTILLSVFGLLPYTASALAWALLNLIVILFVIGQINREVARYSTVRLLWLDLGIVLFVPLVTNIVVLQISLVLMLAVWMSWQALAHYAEWQAGLWLSLFWIKPHLLIVPFVLLVFKRRWRVLGPIIMIGGVLGMLSLWLLGRDGLEAYVQLLATHSGWEYNPDIRWPQMTTSLSGFLQVTLISESFSFVPLAQSLWLAGTLAALALLLAAWRGPWDPTAERFLLQWGLLWATTVFTTPHGYAYELVLLVPPFALAFTHLRGAHRDRLGWLLRTIQYADLVVPAGLAFAFVFTWPLLPLLLGLGNVQLGRAIMAQEIHEVRI